MQCRSCWIIFGKVGNIIRNLSRNRLCTGYVESVCKEKYHWKPMHSATVLRNREIWPWTVCLIFTARKRSLCNRRNFYKNLPLEHEGDTMSGKKKHHHASLVRQIWSKIRSVFPPPPPYTLTSMPDCMGDGGGRIRTYAGLHLGKPKTRIVGMTI